MLHQGEGCSSEEEGTGEGGGVGEMGGESFPPCLCKGARDAGQRSINPLRRKRRIGDPVN